MYITMERTVTRMPDRSDGIRVRAARVCVRLWRREGGTPQGLFTFAGAADAMVLTAVMQHVRRLTAALPDWWRLEVITIGLDGQSLREITGMLRDLQPGGSPMRGERMLNTHQRRRADSRTLSPRPLLPTLLH